RRAQPMRTAASTNQGAHGPSDRSATPLATNATPPSSTSARAAPRSDEMSEKRVVVARTTLTGGFGVEPGRDSMRQRKYPGQRVSINTSRAIFRHRVLIYTALTRAGGCSFLGAVGREAVADPWFADQISGIRGIGLDLLTQLANQDPEVLRLADRIRSP